MDLDALKGKQPDFRGKTISAILEEIFTKKVQALTIIFKCGGFLPSATLIAINLTI